MVKIAFEGIESRLKIIGENCASPGIVIGGGGNYSEKNDEEMIIKYSGGYLVSMTRENMALVKRRGIREALGYDYSSNPDKREKKYKKFLLSSRVDKKNGPRPSVETAVHELLNIYVLHTHATSLTALSCVEEAGKLTKELLGQDYILMDYLDPGILLGIEANRLLKEYGKMPLGILQRNHGVFFTSDNFDKLLEIHNGSVNKISKKIQDGIADKDLLKKPFGDKIISYKNVNEDILKCVMESIYEAIFKQKAQLIPYYEEIGVIKIETQDNALYFNTGDIAKAYAESRRAQELKGKFSWWSPDHLVLCDMTETYIELKNISNAQSIRDDIMEQVKQDKDGLYSRIFIIQGLGIIAVAGHYKEDKDPIIKARLTTQMAYDALLVDIGARALGTPKRVTDKNALFIRGWEVEHERALRMQE